MEEIFVFLTEYTEFLEKMEVTQQEKLDLLLSGDLKKIEQSIMVQQAMDKQLEIWNRPGCVFSGAWSGRENLP